MAKNDNIDNEKLIEELRGLVAKELKKEALIILDLVKVMNETSIDILSITEPLNKEANGYVDEHNRIRKDFMSHPIETIKKIQSKESELNVGLIDMLQKVVKRNVSIIMDLHKTHQKYINLSKEFLKLSKEFEDISKKAR